MLAISLVLRALVNNVLADLLVRHRLGELEARLEVERGALDQLGVPLEREALRLRPKLLGLHIT